MPAAEMPDMLPDMYASLGVGPCPSITEIPSADPTLLSRVPPAHPPAPAPPAGLQASHV